MATGNDTKKPKAIKGNLKKNDSNHRVVNDSALNESTSRDISKMQSPGKWPDPPKKKGL